MTLQGESVPQPKFEALRRGDHRLLNLDNKGREMDGQCRNQSQDITALYGKGGHCKIGLTSSQLQELSTKAP